VTPWSPLKSGVLSGKYTRQSAKQAAPDRRFVTDLLDEKAFAVVDQLERIARELDTTVARVAPLEMAPRSGRRSNLEIRGELRTDSHCRPTTAVRVIGRSSRHTMVRTAVTRRPRPKH